MPFDSNRLSPSQAIGDSPASIFARGYVQHVIPRIRVRIAAGATEILDAQRHGLDRPTYASVFDQIWWYAWRHGAAFLDSNLQNRLDAWIHRRLLSAIAAIENTGLG